MVFPPPLPPFPLPPGWLLFMVFAGVGILSSPIDWIQQFLSRPKSTITKSEYIRRGRLILQRAKECVVSGAEGRGTGEGNAFPPLPATRALCWR